MTQPAPSDSKPTERVPVSAIVIGESVKSIYLLSSMEQRTKKNGDPFFFVTMRDATGSIQGVMWDRHEELLAGTIEVDDFVMVEAFVNEYNGSPQMTVRRLEKVDQSAVDPSGFLPTSPRPRAEMEAELDALIESVTQTDCRRLLDRFFGHARFRDLYCTAPAAAKIHQAYIHGLLEHTLNVVRNALNLANQYGPYDRDLLVTAGLLHDMGKIREYEWKRSITYTDEGRLIGHISIGANMVDGAIREMQRTEGFSSHYHHHILHIILSHHGKLEYGSPVTPKTKEAFLLHYGDYNDAYMASYCDAIGEAQNRNQRWTPYNRMFESYLYAGENEEGGLDSAPSANEENDPRVSRDAVSMDD